MSICCSDLALDVVLGYENRGCVALAPRNEQLRDFHIPNWGCYAVACSYWSQCVHAGQLLEIEFTHFFPKIQRREGKWHAQGHSIKWCWS